MANKITITTLRTWMKARFESDYVHLPDHMQPKWRDLSGLPLHYKISTFTLKSHASKAILIGQDYASKTTKDITFTWAVLNTDRQEVAFYQLSKAGVPVRKIRESELQNVKLVTPFKKKDSASTKALLFYFFLDCGAVEEVTTYDGFIQHLERAFRLFINENKGKAKRVRNEESGNDIESPPAKRREVDHNCHAVHEQLAAEYAKIVKECNQLRRDKEDMGASMAQFKQDSSNKQNWKAEYDQLRVELEQEKDKAKKFVRKLMSEDESEVLALEKYAQELAAYAAKKRAKYAMK